MPPEMEIWSDLPIPR